jgi:alanine racemase
MEDPINARQIAEFDRLRAAFPGVPASFANSSAIFLPQRPYFDLARPGYALYGGNPTPGAKNPMRPVVKLEAPIIQLREIQAGAPVGYNGQWTAARPTRLAVIGLGYADGIPRNTMATDRRPGGEAMVGGRRCRFAGRISMDLTIIDVTDVPAGELAPGIMAELLGQDITIDDLASRAGTIGYEILTNLGRRYHRIHIGG